MKAKSSFCNGPYLGALLKRGWPLWAMYFIILVLWTQEQFSGVPAEEMRIIADLGLVSNVWYTLVLLTFFTAPLAAALTFFHLYDKKQTTLVCALPVGRGAVWGSCFFAGLIPMLAADALAVFLCGVTEAGKYGVLNLPMLLYLLALLVMLNVTFYGFASLCAVLTGNVIVVPLVYLVLGVTAVAVQLFAGTLPRLLLYGFDATRFDLTALSPLYWLSVRQPITIVDYNALRTEPNGRVLLFLGMYCAAGVILAALGRALYKRRAMETTGDVVAVPWLRPAFRWCMGFGCAFGAPCLPWLSRRIASAAYGGPSMTVTCLILALVGGAVGWFGAEMLMRKTARVFKRWRGCCVVAAVAAGVVLCLGLDVGGYEKRVPDPAEVRSVLVIGPFGSSVSITEESSKELTNELHRSVVEAKDKLDDVLPNGSLTFSYYLKDGSTVQRNYYPFDMESAASREIEEKLKALMRSPEGRDELKLDVRPEEADGYDFYVSWYDEAQEEHRAQRLTQAQAAALYAAVEEDIDAGRITGLWLPVRDETEPVFIYFDTVSYAPGGDERMMTGDNLDLRILPEAESTCAWLRENLGIALQ